MLSICVCIALVTPFKYPYSVLLISPLSPIKFAFNRADVVIDACLASKAACKPSVLAIVKSPSVIVACLLFICVCIALVTPFKYPNSVLSTLPSCIKLEFNRADVVIDACFESNAACNPFVLAIVKSPSVIVACLLSICVWIALVTPFK